MISRFDVRNELDHYIMPSSQCVFFPRCMFETVMQPGKHAGFDFDRRWLLFLTGYHGGLCEIAKEAGLKQDD